MVRTAEEVEDEIKSMSRKRDVHIVEANKCQDELVTIMDEYYSLRSDYTMIECWRCKGTGYLKLDDGKKHICDVCNGKEYNWMKMYVTPIPS